MIKLSIKRYNNNNCKTILNNAVSMSASDKQEFCMRSLTGYTWTQEVEEFPIFRVHDGSLDEFNYRMAAVLEFRVTP